MVNALQQSAAFLTTNATARAAVTAGRTQLCETESGLSSRIAGLDGARHALLATDRPAETLRFAIDSITQQTGVAVLTQAQQRNTRLLDLVNLPVTIRTAESAQEVQREPVQQKAPIATSTPTREAS